MAIEYKGIDSVSGKHQYYDTASNTFNLSDTGPDGQEVAVSVPPPEPVTEPRVYTTEELNGGPEKTSEAPAPKDKPDVAETKTDKQEAGAVSTNPEKTYSSNNDVQLFNKKDSPKLLAATEKNVLHNYRSWTYNFCIGAITPEAVSNHRFLERDIKNYTVLDSAGKGTKGIGVSSQGLNEKSLNFKESSQLVKEFNETSPGRFDMFIDNINIDSLIGTGNKAAGSSIATNITFEVYEPYSMNGFVEALQVAAKAAGYSDYIKAAFVLRVQFQGYPDTATNAQMRPEIIPMSVRYFPIKITEIGVDVNEQGTRYRINSVPVPQLALGTPNVLTSDIKVSGKTVGDVLKNLFDAINQQVEDRTKSQTDQKGRDRYEIAAPKLATVGSPQNTKASVLNGSTSTSFTSDIVKAKMNDELKSVNVFKFADLKSAPNATVPGATAETSAPPPTEKLNPDEGTVVFSAGSQIHDCIAAVVRDSTYTRDLLSSENLDKVKKSDGLVTYFTVRMETDILGEDTVNNKRFQVYRYVLEPYQMHYTRIPGQALGEIDLKQIKKKIKREYNYIYTGKNEDVLKFSLKFDNLYYMGIPAMLGNREAAKPLAQAAGPDGMPIAKQATADAVADEKNKPGNSVPLQTSNVDPYQNTFESEAKAGQVQGTPYAKLAQALHNAVLNDVGMISGTLEILGDPYFLVTGGMGNTDLNLKEPMLTVDGQAPTTQGEVFININFRNPIDINSTTGLMDFTSRPLSFSGVYRILSLKNSFKDGIFKQALDVIRVPGQIVDGKTEKLPPNLKTTPRPGQQLVKDIAASDILRSGIRPSDFDLANLLSRGLPSIGLPGNLSNFTNSLIEKTAGATATVGGLLNQVSGATGALNNFSSQLGVSPVAGVNQLTSGIRLAASGLSQISQVPNTLAATVAAAGNTVGNLANIPTAATKLAGNVVDSIKSLPTTAMAAANNIAPNVTGQVSALTQTVTGLASKGYSAVSDLVGDAKNAITGLQNTSLTDLNAVGSKLGIDTSALAGLSPDLASKMANELVEAAKKVPENTDLGSLKEQGMSFIALTGEKLQNLPAVQPKDIAPLAFTDPGVSEIAKKYGNVSSLLSGNISLPPLTDINKVTNPLGTLSAGLTSGIKTVAGSAQTIMGAVSNANTYVNSAIGQAAGIVNNVGSLAQNSIQGFSAASAGLGSVESNLANVANLTQNVTSQVNNLGISVTSQYGSLQSSPLAKLIRNNNIEGIV